jgi:hypothetical protein
VKVVSTLSKLSYPSILAQVNPKLRQLPVLGSHTCVPFFINSASNYSGVILN